MKSKEYYYLDFLNKNCPISEEWRYEKPVYCIKVQKDVQDKISDWMEKIVNCSFFYEVDEDEYLNLKVTNSTLEPKLDEIIKVNQIDDEDTVKIDRFFVKQGTKGRFDEHYFYIIDKETLTLEGGRAVNDFGPGVIFVAASTSEWVNYTLISEVLQMLNSEDAYHGMIDYCNRKYVID